MNKHFRMLILKLFFFSFSELPSRSPVVGGGHEVGGGGQDVQQLAGVRGHRGQGLGREDSRALWRVGPRVRLLGK